MSRIDICYATFRLETQTAAPTLTVFQGIKLCVQYVAGHPHKPVFVLLILMMTQISSELYGVGIKLKTTSLRIVYNSIKIRIILLLSIENGQLEVFFILRLVLLSVVNYRFNQL